MTTHPFYPEVTTATALRLAKTLLHGPLPKANAPTPSIDEAIKVISDNLGRCGHTWITGEVSLEVLRLERGEKITCRT